MATVIERPGRGLVRLTGPQRIWFLQNTITQDVDDLPSGRWVESCFLDLKGKVVAHFRVGVLDDEVWLDVDPPGTGPLVDWFSRYRFRTKVEIEDVSRTCYTVHGADAEDGTLRTGPAFGGRLADTPTLDVYEPPDGPSEDESLYERLRIEAGVPRFGVDYGPDALPQEAGLTPIVSVTKGCYVGQEVMARLHFRGHVNKTVRTLALSEPVAAPSELRRNGERVGKVTSVAGLKGIGMVRVVVAPGEVVEVDGGATATVGPLPEGTKLG